MGFLAAEFLHTKQRNIRLILFLPRDFGSTVLSTAHLRHSRNTGPAVQHRNSSKDIFHLFHLCRGEADISQGISPPTITNRFSTLHIHIPWHWGWVSTAAAAGSLDQHPCDLQLNISLSLPRETSILPAWSDSSSPAQILLFKYSQKVKVLDITKNTHLHISSLILSVTKGQDKLSSRSLPILL